MLSNHQKVVGHMPPGPTYGDTPESLFKYFSLSNKREAHSYQFLEKIQGDKVFKSLFLRI